MSLCNKQTCNFVQCKRTEIFFPLPKISKPIDLDFKVQ